MTTPLPAWAALVRDVPDFPQPGILFKDITTLIKDGDAFRQVIGALVNRYRGQKIDRIVGVESRGFIFAAPLAYELGAGFVPVRKPGKLPADAIKTEYLLEYGANTLEVHKDAIDPGQSVLIVDDVLATGGSAAATVKLVEELGGAVIGIAFVIELGFLNGRKRLGSYELFSLLTYSMKTVEWHDDGPEVWLIDQTRLPLEEVVVRCRDYRAVALAIKTMQVRGAPAIGVTAAMGVALAAVEATDEREWFDRHVEKACKELASTRPTAINLFWAIQRMQEKKASLNDRPAMQIRAGLIEEAKRLAIEDEARCRQIGQHGAALFADGDGVLTHCNAGALACVDYGTALGPLRAAHELGKRLHVFVDETRPFLQGSRLTAWELGRDGIDSTLITDNMAAYVMGQGKVQKVIVGADRIAANGDVANKIGTYGVAIIAHAHGIPFYVAAPTSTIDFAVATGADIPIEERSPDEVTHFRGVQVAPHGMRAAHPAFDVTPARYVTAIITEEGIHEPPYSRSLAMVRK